MMHASYLARLAISLLGEARRYSEACAKRLPEGKDKRSLLNLVEGLSAAIDAVSSCNLVHEFHKDV